MGPVAVKAGLQIPTSTTVAAGPCVSTFPIPFMQAALVEPLAGGNDPVNLFEPSFPPEVPQLNSTYSGHQDDYDDKPHRVLHAGKPPDIHSQQAGNKAERQCNCRDNRWDAQTFLYM